MNSSRLAESGIFSLAANGEFYFLSKTTSHRLVACCCALPYQVVFEHAQKISDISIFPAITLTLKKGGK